VVKKIFQQLLGILILLGFLAGLLAIIFVPVEMYKMHQARGWASRDGTITHSSPTLGRRGFRNAPSWRADVGGTYDDNGEKFWVSRVRYGGFRWGAGKAAVMEDIVKYPVGTKVRVYHSPSRPKDTILEPFAPWDTMIITLAVGVGLVLLPLVLYLFRKQLGHKDT
jgi:Protein of unknown function (DUF3592)